MQTSVQDREYYKTTLNKEHPYSRDFKTMPSFIRKRIRAGNERIAPYSITGIGLLANDGGYCEQIVNES